MYQTSMMLIIENLRAFMTSRPPVVLFMLSLAMFAIALVTLAYVVKNNDLRNPDEMDWNEFLHNVQNVQFCMVKEETNTSSVSETPLNQKPYHEVVSDIHSKIKGDNPHATTDSSSSSGSDVITVPVPLLVKVRPTLDFVSIPHNVTHLTTNMNGRQIGLEGTHADTPFNVSLTLPHDWNSTRCPSDGECDKVQILTCVHFQAPASLFPPSKRPNAGRTCETINSTSGVDSYFSMVVYKNDEKQSTESICKNLAGLTINHENDATLNIMLTLQDRSAINLHLMHTSYFLFVMVITMLCYAIVRGHPATKSKPIHYSEVPTKA